MGRRGDRHHIVQRHHGIGTKIVRIAPHTWDCRGDSVPSASPSGITTFTPIYSSSSPPIDFEVGNLQQRM
jgi:hypothetical protein